MFITLGDGDFTWSLDLGRYLCSTDQFGRRKRKLIATGIDSVEQVELKYLNSPCIFRELKHLQHASDELFSIELHHGINAICSDDKQLLCGKGQIVIFNHPHLGTEDAVLHSQFLCHLFQSVAQFWLLPTGVFYLTLIKDQFERWNCEDAARRHGMEIRHRYTFISAPSVVSEPRYEQRRHQTGKSFASKSQGSETFLFVHKRKEMDASNDNMWIPCLPWFGANCENENNDSFSCNVCGKMFREKRSLKNHTLSKHGIKTCLTKKIKEPDNAAETFECLSCQICEASLGDMRSFETVEALQDHVKAKHDALHTTISSQFSSKNKIYHNSLKTFLFGECSVCGKRFSDVKECQSHMEAFIPKEIGGVSDETDTFICAFCTKTFPQQRAQLQHENSCSQRIK